MIGEQIRTAREAAGLSLREVARRSYLNPGYLSQIEHDARLPSPKVLAALGEVLGVKLELPVPVTVKPSRINLTPEAPGILADILAGQRRLEDVIGARPVRASADAHATLAAGLVTDASGALRARVLDVAAQWAQFAGWLHTATGDYPKAHRWLDRAMEWAMETGDRDMVATGLSFKGHIAYLIGKPGAVVGLSRAAAREGSYVGQRAYDAFQEAKGHAMLGDRRAAADSAAAGVDLAAETGEYTGVTPPWQYYRTPGFFALERSLVHRLLGDDAAADDLLGEGLAALPEDQRGAEWATAYRPPAR